jgi:carboxymethylenebutenolidase
MTSPPGTLVTIPQPDGRGNPLKGYLVRPSQTPARGVLLLHEAYGLNDNMRDLTHRFAEAGYFALAADLFSDGNRILCMFRAFYGLLVAPLKNSTTDKVRTVFHFLQNVEGVDRSRVGAIGFCLGGSFALQLACVDDSVRAISVVSGQNPRPQDALKRSCPVVGSYAQGDFTQGAARTLDLVLDEYNVPHDIKIYDGGIHSLMNTGARNYNPVIAADAWQRTLAFFDKHLSA